MSNKNLKKFISTLFCLICILLFTGNTYASNAKREFRGAWIQCVNGQFNGMGTEKMKATLTYQLDELQKDGVNAIIFQVRPECDAHHTLLHGKPEQVPPVCIPDLPCQFLVLPQAAPQ